VAVFYPGCRALLTVTFDGFGGGEQKPTIIGREGDLIPLSATVNLNGYKQADTFELTFDAKRLPIVPDLIRGGVVDLWLFDTQGAAFNPNRHLTEENLEIVGAFGAADFTYDESGRVFRIEGTDLTGLLLKKKWDTSKRVPVGLPLDQIVQKLVDEVTTSGRTLTVRYRDGSALPTVASVSKQITSRKVTVQKPISGNGHSRTKKKAGFPVATGKSYWDVIYDLCQAHGHIAYVQGYDVILAPIVVLTAEAEAQIPKVAYGRNLTSLKWHRQFGKDSTPEVVFRSYDKRTRKELVARWPRNYRGKPSGAGTLTQEQIEVRYDSVNELALLEEMAKNYYLDLARGESEVTVATRSLVDLDGRDLLHLRAGQPVSIAFDAFNSEVLQQLSEEERFQNLVDQGYDDVVAQLIASEFTKIRQFTRPFYTKQATKRWGITDGISLEIEGINFVSVKRDGRTV